MRQKITLIFDIGKTNKKYFLFDENLVEVKSAYKQIPEVTDDDGFACDDLTSIEHWVFSVYEEIKSNADYEISFVNFSTYGATMVHLDESGKPCTPLYNYLKDIPDDIKQLFEQKYGDINTWSRQTASPFLGMLNAGLQLFWLKYKKSALFKKIGKTVFLPQYLSYRFSKELITEFTGIGCHTGMWDFGKNDYHLWMYAEGFIKLLPEMHPTDTSFIIPGTSIKVGAGIHDSSAALIPYLLKVSEPFILLSTGTWSICLNPFNDEPLTEEELSEDCLCYLQPDGKQVKASRYFLGNKFTQWVKKLDMHFNRQANYHYTISFQNKLLTKAEGILSSLFTGNSNINDIYFSKMDITDLNWFDNYEEAYHHLLKELVEKQVQKIGLVIGSVKINTIYVDGGFAGNKVFIAMLQEMMPHFNIIPSEMPLGTSLGAALMDTDANLKIQAVLLTQTNQA